MTATDDLIADRYGRRPRDPRRRSRLRMAAVLLLVAGVALAAWLAAARSARTADWRDLGVQEDTISDSAITITFQVIVPPGSGAVCTLHAVNARLVDVGRVDVRIAPSPTGRTTRTVTLRTSERADGAAVRTCIRG